MIKKILTFIWVVSIISSGIAQTPAYLASALQAIVNNTVPSGKTNPGIVTGVHVPGQWSWYGASGNSIAGITPGYPVKTALVTDRFRIGSITKMFMATSILLLEENGLLDINDDISLYLRSSLVNDTIKSSDIVLIKNLLNHTSGIADLAANDSCRMAALADLTRDYTLEEVIYCGCIQGEYFPPGFAWGYSNTNYTILALIIEEVSGVSAADYITANIINPLGLMNTEVPETDEISNSHMGCYWDLPPLMDLTIVDASLYNGWANIVSNTEDLFLFFDALRNGNLVNTSSLAKMFSVSPASFDYGLAIDFYEINGDSYYGHSGEVGNTSGLFFGDIATEAFPDGYYIAYNYNYQGVNYNTIEESVHMLMKTYVQDTTTTLDTTLLSDTFHDKAGNMFVFPNPATDQFSIRLNGKISTAFRLEIYDVTGRKFSGFTQTISKGLLKVSGLDLKPGIYQVICGLGEVNYASRLLIR